MDNDQAQPANEANGDNKTYYDIEEVRNRLMLPEDVLFNLIERFIDSYGDVAIKISTLVYDNDFEQAAELVHSAKGVSGSLGANAFYEKCKEIESLLRNGQNDEAKTAMPVLMTTAERTISVMKAALDQHKSA